MQTVLNAHYNDLMLRKGTNRADRAYRLYLQLSSAVEFSHARFRNAFITVLHPGHARADDGGSRLHSYCPCPDWDRYQHRHRAAADPGLCPAADSRGRLPVDPGLLGL